MNDFDPAAATAAYLAQLPPEAHARAQAYTQGGYWLLLWGAVIAVAIALVVLRSGLLVRLRRRIENRRRRPWLAAFAVVGAYAAIETLLFLPWRVYADWWRERSYGLSNQTLAAWLGEWGLMTAISLPVTLVLIAVLYALIRRAPRSWWLWSGGGVGLFFLFTIVIAPVLILPLFNAYEPAPPGPVRTAVEEMAQAHGVPADKIYIYDGSKQSNRYTANVTGLFGTAQISMSDVMFQKGADLAEVRAVIGHEIGHYKRGHALWLAGAYTLLALAAFFLVDRLFPVVRRWVGADDVEGLADPAGYPIISIIISVLALLATPLANSVSRIAEVDADRYSLERVGEPDGLARALVKTIEYRAATPTRLEEIIFYTHPSVGSRIRRAMEWKARHGAAEAGERVSSSVERP